MANMNLTKKSDADIAARLQELFNLTVNLQVELDNTESESERLKIERRSLALQLKRAHNEISQLVTEIKSRMPASRTLKKVERLYVQASI
jgi:hypothetical protein